jgi:hypothetical protein
MSAPNPSGIARVAYEAARAYATVLGRAVPPCWLEATPAQRWQVLRGVQAVLSGEVRSGAQIYDLWSRAASAGAPPSALEPAYERLPLPERRRVLLFRAVVLALIDGPCNGDCHDEACPVVDDHDCHLETCVSRFGVPPGGALLAAALRPFCS